MKPRYLVGALLLSSCLVAPGFALAQATEVEEVVITGQRASDRESLEKKREALTAVEVVSANDVGKLPDQNVADAVRRLSGVSVATDKGEGRYLIIRGIEPNLANVTINNQTASAPEPESRNVKLDDIPSALIGSVTVVKSLTPDLDANAIAGQVDIGTLSAFDKGKTIFNARVAGGVYEMTDERAIEGDLSFGGLFGPDRQFGFVVALNYSNRPSVSEDVLSGGRQTVGGVDLPVELDNRFYDPAERTRTGAVVNLDWRPNDDTKLYARVMYSKFDDDETRNRFRFFFPTALANYSSLNEDGGTFTAGASGRRMVRERQEVTDTTTIAVGGEFHLGEGLLTIQATHGLATKEDPVRDEIEYRYNTGGGAGQITGSFVSGNAVPGTLTLSANAFNPAFYRLRSFKMVSREAEEDLNQVRADYQFPIGAWGEGSYLKVGAKYLHRDKFTDATGRVLSYSGPTNTLVGETSRTISSTYGGRFPFGPAVDYGLVKEFYLANPGLFTNSAADELVETLGEDYNVIEKISAAYVMANLTFGDLSLIPGVRVEHTEGDTKAIAVTPTATVNDSYNQFGSYSYTNWFPGVNVRYQFTPDLQGRIAVTTAIGRPEYSQLAPTLSVSVGDNEVTMGNPDLEPQEAVNFDASLEYYFEGEGGISVGLFRKQIDKPIFASTSVETGSFGGIPLVGADVFSFQNGTEAEVTGLEFSFQKPLTMLPSPFDGLGVNVNATFVDGKLAVPGRSGKVQLPKQSKRIASAQVYYEKYGFSARVAYTYRSAYLDIIDTSDTSGDGDIYFDELSTVSVKVAYKVNDQIEVFAEGNNLNDAMDYYYYNSRSRFAEAETYGRSYRFGLSYTF